MAVKLIPSAHCWVPVVNLSLIVPEPVSIAITLKELAAMANGEIIRCFPLTSLHCFSF